MALPYVFTAGTSAKNSEQNANFTYLNNRIRSGTGSTTLILGNENDVYFQWVN